MATNFLDLATGVLIPSGYKAEKLYGIVPVNDNTTGIDTDAFDWELTRNSVATRVNSDLLLEEMAIDVPRLQYEGTSCPNLLVESTSTNNVLYPLSFFNKDYWDDSNCTIEGDPATGGEDVMNGWNFEEGWTTAAATINSDVEFETVGSGGLYSPLDTVEIGKQYEVILEGTTTAPTLALRCRTTNTFMSESLTGTFDVKFQCSPDNGSWYLRNSGGGTTNIKTFEVREVQGYESPHSDYPTSAQKITADSDYADFDLVTPFVVPDDTIYSNSIYIKRASGTGTIGFRLIDGGRILIPVTDEWQRFEAIAETFGTSGYIGLRIFEEDDSFYIFGAQSEESRYVSSLIYDGTEGSTTTRAAEYCKIQDLQSKGLISDPDNFTIFLDIQDVPDTAQNYLWTFANSAGTGQFRLQLRNDTSSYWRIYANVDSIWYTAFDDEDLPAKIAIRFTGGNTLQMFKNGVKASTDYTFTNTVSFDRIFNDSKRSQDESSIMLFPTSLTDAQCIELTTL